MTPDNQLYSPSPDIGKAAPSGSRALSAPEILARERRRFGPRLRLAAGAAVVLALSLAGWRAGHKAKRVQIVRPQRQTVVEILAATGRIRARRVSPVGANAGGIVQKVQVDEGDSVTTGQLLFSLVADDVREALESARRRLETAEFELAALEAKVRLEEIERAREILRERGAVAQKALSDRDRGAKLYEKQAVSSQEAEDALLKWEEAEASRAVARRDLDLLLLEPRPENVRVSRAKIAEAKSEVERQRRLLEKLEARAPFSGLIVRRAVEPGQSASPGQDLLTLADLGSLEIYVETDEINLGRLRPGQRADVIPPSNPSAAFPARLERIESRVNASQGVIALNIKANQYPANMRLDMTVDVNIETRRFENSLTLPAAAVNRNGRDYFAKTLEKGRVAEQKVQLSGRSAERAAIEGLAETASVLANPTAAEKGDRAEAIVSDVR